MSRWALCLGDLASILDIMSRVLKKEDFESWMCRIILRNNYWDKSTSNFKLKL